MRLTFFILVLLLPAILNAASHNAGFIEGLWYSDSPVFADKTVRVYAAIRNNTGADLTGRIEFYDNDELIARQNVSALSGRIVESWADWEPSAGHHTLRATLSRTELHQVGAGAQPIEVISASAEDSIYVDLDTDGDGVGNQDDADDDGDGYSDEEERDNGTNPLKADPPPAVLGAELSSESGDEADEGGSKAAAPTETNPPHTGLERYLTPSPARTAFERLTQTVVQSKQNLDAYRDSRLKAITAADAPKPIEVDASGFGEISRSSSEGVPEPEPKESKAGFVGSAIAFIGGIIQTIYTVSLTLASLYLSYVVLVQLTVLLLILFVIYKLARKFGVRPD